MIHSKPVKKNAAFPLCCVELIKQLRLPDQYFFQPLLLKYLAVV